MVFSPSRIPRKLSEAYLENRCAVLVGAGASVGAGLPSWEGLLTSMIAHAEGHGALDPPAKGDEYRKLLADPSKYLMIASGLKEDMHSYFDEFIVQEFINTKSQPTSFHKALVGAKKFQFVVTTNYDTLIERAYRSMGREEVTVCTFTDAGEVQRRLSSREFFVLKAHGDASRVGNGIILTDTDYRRVLYRERAYQSLLQAIFTMFTVVFLGASMADPEIKLLLNYVADAYTATSGPSHFALMTQEDITGVERQRWFKDLKVQLIPVSKQDNYSEVTEFLDLLGAGA